MSSTVIKVENLSKQYRLGQVSTGTMVHDLNRLWYKVRGKEDPYLKIGEVNDRTNIGDSDYVWALRDVNFDVKQGDTIGIIGKNGAGKSTLLKLLSRVTGPTTGNIKIKGRIASLLEVGTGFHPELTGKENIFLNGAILGMTKREISTKLDEIVDFSGVAKYVDTPVKRYSSGMYVRLAFAVAAHLDPEILIVDEVLAVGDAEFQKKCLGKMKDVSQQGRTVLFVSHNMTAVQSLCEKAIFMQNGTLRSMGTSGDIIHEYLRVFADMNVKQVWDEVSAPGTEEAKLLKAEVHVPKGRDVFYMNEQVEIEFTFLNNGTGKAENYDITFHLTDELNNIVFVGSTARENQVQQDKGLFNAKAIIPADLLNEGTYTISRLLFVRNRGHIVYEHRDVLTFEVVKQGQALGWIGGKEGITRPKINWQIQLTND